MPKNIGNRKINRKPRDTGYFRSVHEFMLYQCEKFKKADTEEKKQRVLARVTKAGIRTKQFIQFYEQKSMEK